MITVKNDEKTRIFTVLKADLPAASRLQPIGRREDLSYIGFSN
jgi:hypothetical protein